MYGYVLSIEKVMSNIFTSTIFTLFNSVEFKEQFIVKALSASFLSLQMQVIRSIFDLESKLLYECVCPSLTYILTKVICSKTFIELILQNTKIQKYKKCLDQIGFCLILFSQFKAFVVYLFHGGLIEFKVTFLKTKYLQQAIFVF